MATTDTAAAAAAGTAERWYPFSADDVAGRFGVDPASGLSAAKAAEMLQKDGPNELPVEEGEPGWRRFLDQYRALLVVLMVIGSILLAFLLAGILFANLRFFIWLAVIGLVVWGIYMLITRPWRYS